MKAPLGWMLGIAAIIAASRVNAGDAPAPDVQRRITLGAPGEPQIVLSAENGGASIVFWDANGHQRLELSLKPDDALGGSPLRVIGKTAPHPSLWMHGERINPASTATGGSVSLEIGPAGSPSLRLMTGGRDDDPMALLFADRNVKSFDGAYLQLSGGVVPKALLSASHDSAGLGLNTDQWTANLAAVAGPDGTASINVGRVTQIPDTAGLSTDEVLKRMDQMGGTPGIHGLSDPTGTDLAISDLAGMQRVGLGAARPARGDNKSRRAFSPGTVVVFDEEGKPVWRAPMPK